MRLAVAHIAFKNTPLEQIFTQLEGSPIEGIEIAPTLLWNEPVKSSAAERQKIKSLIAAHQLEMIGLQSVLYGQAHLEIFSSTTSRDSCLDYLKRMVELCRDLGGALISFGALKNRRRGTTEVPEAVEIAADFFQKLAAAAANFGVVICFEPIAEAFGCDFMNTAKEAHQLVVRLNHPSFRLLLDTGSMAMNNEPIADTLKIYASQVHHVQVNDPYLTPPGNRGVDHKVISEALKQIGYQRWVTIECFLKNAGSLDELTYAMECYGETSGYPRVVIS